MTDSTPDDKNLADEAATTEEAVQDTADEVAEETADATQESADAPEEAAAQDEAPTEKVSTAKKAPAKKRPAPPVEDDEDDDEEPAPVRRPKASARVAAARPASAAGATITTVVVTVVVIALLAGTIIFALLWNNERNELNDLKTAAANREKAEKVAADYATGASSFDYRDLGPWRAALTKNVSPELKAKSEAGLGAINQLLQPLQWVSKGTVLDAVVNSESGPVYKVSVYVNVEASNVQAPSGRDVTAVYIVTTDKDKDWLITDIGGNGAGVPASVVNQPADPTAGAPAPTTAATPAPGN